MVGTRRLVRPRWDDLLIYGFLALFAVLTIYPFINVLSVSISSYNAYLRNPMLLIPRDIELSAYRFVFGHHLILSSYRNTIFVTIVGTAFRMLLITLTAYPLARRGLRLKPLFMTVLVITIIFNGGIVPNFVLVRRLGMYNTIWALIIPAALPAFYVILMKNFFESIPDSLLEAARIDGATELFTLTRVVLPLSTAIIATLALFNAVALWNSFFSAVIYIRDRNLWTLQLLLREIVIENTTVLEDPLTSQEEFTPQNLKYAVIFVAILPILCLYPFLQRYFIKGIMIGAIKG